ncbi:hypothetical protein ACN47E_002807 [Coniothyrium glycines]
MSSYDDDDGSYRDTQGDNSSVSDINTPSRGGRGTQSLVHLAGANITTGPRSRAPPVHFSPINYNAPAKQRAQRPPGPAGIVPDEDVSTSELPGLALADVDRYAKLARGIPVDGFLPLIRAGCEDELNSGSPLTACFDDPEHLALFPNLWNAACHQFFCSMNEDVLIECIAGNIDRAYHQSKKDGTALADYLDKLFLRSKTHPSCYVRVLTDDDGNSMPLDEYEQLLAAAEAYCGNDDIAVREAFQIDLVADVDDSDSSDSQHSGWTLDDSRKGLRRHFKTGATDVSESRRKVLRAWIKAGKERVTHCEIFKAGLEPPIQYVGYAFDAQNRKKGHERRSTASWICQLVSDICTVKWPQKYSLKFYVVCLLSDQPMGQFSEIILSRYFRAYVVHGGLSIDWAGKSTESLTLSKLSQEDQDQFWPEKQEYIRKELDFMANFDKEIDRRYLLQKRELEEEEEKVNEHCRYFQAVREEFHANVEWLHETLDDIARFGGERDEFLHETVDAARRLLDRKA